MEIRNNEIKLAFNLVMDNHYCIVLVADNAKLDFNRYSQEIQLTIRIYDIKLKSRLSVCLSAVTSRYSAVSAWIDVRFARNEASILGKLGVCFKKVLITVVRRLRRVECLRVDDFLLNLEQHSCKPQPRRN